MKTSIRSAINVFLLATLVLGLTGQSSAHHSPAQYERLVIVEKNATVIRFEFRNPHTYILVRDSDDAEWMLETSSAVRLRRDGWSEDLFSPGDNITFSAHSNKNPQKNRLYLSSVTTSTGKTFDLHAEDDESEDSAPTAEVTSLAGIWRVNTENFDKVFDYFENHPITAKALEAQAAYDETTDPVSDCVAYPTPQLVMVSYIYPMKIEFTDEAVIFHHEFFNTMRTVDMGVREHPADTARTNQGHSVGYWDDKSLVVDTRYFADHRNPMLGDFPSGEGKHVIERYALSEDGTHAVVSIFLEDPEYLAEPMNYELILAHAPDEELQDFECDPEIAKRYTE
jgi:hypothetical protein